ncbi:MAG: hypothetical protein ACOYNY_03010 [Caldilineaceae bacterium]
MPATVHPPLQECTLAELNTFVNPALDTMRDEFLVALAKATT